MKKQCKTCHWANPLGKEYQIHKTIKTISCDVPLPEWMPLEVGNKFRFETGGDDCNCWKRRK